MARKRTSYRDIAVTTYPGEPVVQRRCGHCTRHNVVGLRVCRNCGFEMVRSKRRPKPRRGTEDRLRIDLAHAEKMADLWRVKVTAAVLKMRDWTLRERALARRLSAGPTSPKPKRERKVRRAMKLEGGTS